MRCNDEPNLLRCTKRDGWDNFDPEQLFDAPYIDLECRFSNGEKFGAVRIDSKFRNMADAIHDFLNDVYSKS